MKKKLKIFNRQTEGDKLLNSIIKDIQENSISVSKAPKFVLYSNSWWQFLSIKGETLTIRNKDSKPKEKNKHYTLSNRTLENFINLYENL